MSKLKILELFGGIGSCSKALERLGIDYEIADYVEIDKYAVKSFNAIHNTNFEPQNRERVFTVSILDNQTEKDEKISLIVKNFRFPEKKELKLKLKNMLEENVEEKYYLSDKKIQKIANWKAYQKPFEKVQGKNSIVPTLTARGAGEEHSGMITYSENLEDTTNLQEQCLHIKNNTIQGYLSAYDGDGVNISSRMKYQRGNVQKESIQTITTSGGNDRGVVVSDKPRKDIKELEKYCEYCGKQLERKRFNGRLEDFTVFKNRKYCNRECMRKDWVKIGDNHNQSYSNAHTTARKINELILHKEVCELCGSDTNLDIHHIDGNWQNNNLDNLMCLCRSCHTRYERNKDKTKLRIRKLTPREVWRLMGFDDADFEKASKVNSNSQLYKQAGNSIVVNVLEAIFNNLLIDYKQDVKK